MKTGARYLGGRKCEFVVWAPFLNDVTLKIVSPDERVIPLVKNERGYWKTTVFDVDPCATYFYNLNGGSERPDPASYFQPEGVHRPSQVIDHSKFKWGDANWNGISLKEMVMYELHVGTFTNEGTFSAVIGRLSELVELGINAIEIMPVAQFPGGRNWGYDGVHPYAVQNTYGGPDGLKELVNAAHKHGIAVILDVVYNHIGPEGNYLAEFGPYFTSKYKSPWGMAVNFDDAYSDEVRSFFIENALYWFREYHIDALRIDAIHGIYDLSAKPFLEDLAEKVDQYSKEKGRKFYLIAESDLNDARVIRPRESGGYGIDAQWNDDYHHCIHTLLTGEKSGYYEDFGRAEDLVASLKDGFVYSWRYSPYRKRHHGNSSADRPSDQFVVFAQNHDQVGNRAQSNRLSKMVSFEALKLAAGIVFLSPYVPLVFMGEEYGEDKPFNYFTSHNDPGLIEAVREGRQKEFAAFKWDVKIPDPQDEKTFVESKIDWGKRGAEPNRALLAFYKNLIELRRTVPALADLNRNNMEVSCDEKKRVLLFRRWYKESHIICIFNFSDRQEIIDVHMPAGAWKALLDSSDEKWSGQGSLLPKDISNDTRLTLKPKSFAVYMLE